jgi:hypothetical protein
MFLQPANRRIHNFTCFLGKVQEFTRSPLAGLLLLSFSATRQGVDIVESASVCFTRPALDAFAEGLRADAEFAGRVASALARSFPLALAWSCTGEERDWEWKRGAGVPRSSAVGVL